MLAYWILVGLAIALALLSLRGDRARADFIAEALARRPSPQDLPPATVIVPVKDAEGNATHYLSLRTLITGRKKLEQQAERNKSALEALVAMTSDKVKYPITNCLRQISRLDAGTPLNTTEMQTTVTDLKASTLEVEAHLKDLATFVRGMKVS